MPTTNANLQVQPGQNPDPNWIQTQARNNPSLWYSYQYTGGTDNHGGMDVVVGRGAQTLHVDLDTVQQRYSIADVSFGDPSNQLSVQGPRQGNNVNILDKNDTAEDGYYGLFVTDSTNGASVYCDPMIKNEPGSPPQAQWRRSGA